jgi:hypothetical protein
MRVPSACLSIVCCLALTSHPGSARAGDSASSGTGGAGGSAASGGAGGAGGGAEPVVQPSATPDNFGCSAAGPASDGAGAAGFLLLGAALACGSVRRRRHE